MNINTFVYQPASMITWTMLYMDSNSIRTTLALQPYTHMYGTLASGWILRLKPTTLKHHSNTLRTSRCRRALSLRLAVKVWVWTHACISTIKAVRGDLACPLSVWYTIYISE